MKWSVMAACAAVIFGLGAAQMGLHWPSPSSPCVESIPVVTGAPTFSADADSTAHSFVAQGPGGQAKLPFPAVYPVTYADVTQRPELASSIALPDGSFWVELDKADIQKFFWGPTGKPEADNPKTDPGDFPPLLMNWADYTISGHAIYDGEGALWLLTITGEKGEDSFTLNAASGRLPPQCAVDVTEETTTVLGAEITGSRRSYDRDGDGVEEHVVTAAFFSGETGIRFQNVGSGGLRVDDGTTDPAQAGAEMFNAMLVNQALKREPYLGHLLHTNAIPAWTEAELETIEQARGETAFAPWLPEEGPTGYGEFYGRLSYQEGSRNQLYVRWSVAGGYDDVEVRIHLPEGKDTEYLLEALVDTAAPESYDWRLYDGPICDVVPEQYQLHFYCPTFRAGEMSLSIVEARMTAHDTGGSSCNFNVLHENGVVVCYHCDGLSAGQVWAMVEATLSAE